MSSSLGSFAEQLIQVQLSTGHRGRQPRPAHVLQLQPHRHHRRLPLPAQRHLPLQAQPQAVRTGGMLSLPCWMPSGRGQLFVTAHCVTLVLEPSPRR